MLFSKNSKNKGNVLMCPQYKCYTVTDGQDRTVDLCDAVITLIINQRNHLIKIINGQILLIFEFYNYGTHHARTVL